MNSVQRHEQRYQRRKLARERKRLRRLCDTGALPKAASLDALVRASRRCESGVAWKRGVQGFCLNRVFNCAMLRKRLLDGSYKPGTGKRFVVNERGKKRDIHAVPFADRVVQRALCDEVLLPQVRPALICDNGASLKGKGVSFAIARLEKHLREHFRAYGAGGCILLFDFSKFFENIDVDRLMEKLAQIIPDKDLVCLAERFLRSESRGLGLGNQTSQLGAILYPSAIDHWIKDERGIKGYGRYMDDGYVLFGDWQEMRRFAIEFQQRCEAEGIVINPRKFRMLHIEDPFVFLKTRFQIQPDGRIVKRVCVDNIKREKRKLRKMMGLVREGRLELSALGASYASWRGTLLRGSASRLLQRKMDEYFKSVCGCAWRECVLEAP